MKFARLALVAAFIPAIAISQGPPPGPMSLKDNYGNVLTLNGPPAAQMTGSYLDNMGLGGCTSGQTYQLGSITTSGGPQAAISFNTPLCSGVSLEFSGTFTPPSGPGQPNPGIQANLKVSFSSTFTAQPPSP